MNKRRIFSTFISVILGLFCIIPSPKATPPTQPYTDDAFYRLCEFARKNPDTAGRIFKEIELLAQGVHSDKALIDYENPAKSICCFLRCEESEVYPLLKVKKRWFWKKESERILILNHFFKLLQHSKIQLGYGIKENETDYYTAEAFDRMTKYLTENRCQEPGNTFFEEIERAEQFSKIKSFCGIVPPSRLIIDLSNPAPKLVEILECSDEKKLAELLKCEKGREVLGLSKNLSPKNRMLENFFILVRDAKQEFLRVNP